MTTVLNEIMQYIQKHNAKFLSLKFVDEIGVLRQLDIAVKNLQTNDLFITNNNMQLQPIKAKYFLDPFRSLPTIFCLCENLTDKLDVRAQVKTRIEQSTASSNIPCECHIDFSVLEITEKHFEEPVKKTAKSITSSNVDIYNYTPSITSPNILSTELTTEESSKILIEVNERANFEHFKEITLEKKRIYYEKQIEPIDKSSNLRSEIVNILENIGIKTSFHCHNNQESGCRIGIVTDDILDMADNLIITQYIIENVANSYGKAVNLTPYKFSSELSHNLNNETDPRNTIKLFLYFSNYEKQIAKSFMLNVQQNAKNILSFERIGQNINLDWFKQNTGISIDFSTIPINPYLAFSSIILYGVGYNGNLLSILSQETLRALSTYYSDLLIS